MPTQNAYFSTLIKGQAQVILIGLADIAVLNNYICAHCNEYIYENAIVFGL